ncbi:MAG TPA: EcsC family protein, partial [Thermoleophilia bacterium]
LMRGLEFSIYTLGGREPRRPRYLLHKLVVVGSGTASGLIGLAALAVELPFSTCIILRSIADIARAEGHDLSDMEVRLECLEVLALGGRSRKDDAVESGYWMVRGALAKSVSEAASHLAEKGLTKEGAPALVRFIAIIGSRFSTLVTEEAAAKAIPVVGALSGGTINYLFMDHFQEMAKGHFVVKRLEKKYGAALVEKTYKDLLL